MELNHSVRIILLYFIKKLLTFGRNSGKLKQIGLVKY